MWTAVGSGCRRQDLNRHQSSRSVGHDFERAGQHLDVRIQPLQRQPRRLVVRPGLRAARLRRRAEERRGDAVARLEVRLVEPQQDAHVHDPVGSEVVRRQAAHRGRRPLHLPADQEAQGPRSPGRLVGAEERHAQGQTRSSSTSRPPRCRTSTTSPARHRSCRSTSGSRSRTRSRSRTATKPVGSGPFTIDLLLATGDEVHEEPALLAEGQAEDRHGLLPGLHRRTIRRTRTWRAARPSGAASSSRASRPSTSRRARTTTTGSRRSRTSRSSSTSRTRSSRTSPSAGPWRTRSTARASRRSASTATSRRRTRPGS